MDLGPNAVFIWASYGATALVLGLLTVWLVLEGSRLQRLIDRLEQRGIRRRPGSPSQSGAPPGTEPQA